MDCGGIYVCLNYLVCCSNMEGPCDTSATCWLEKTAWLIKHAFAVAFMSSFSCLISLYYFFFLLSFLSHTNVYSWEKIQFLLTRKNYLKKIKKIKKTKIKGAIVQLIKTIVIKTDNDLKQAFLTSIPCNIRLRNKPRF